MTKGQLSITRLRFVYASFLLHHFCCCHVQSKLHTYKKISARAIEKAIICARANCIHLFNAVSNDVRDIDWVTIRVLRDFHLPCECAAVAAVAAHEFHWFDRAKNEKAKTNWSEKRTKSNYRRNFFFLSSIILIFVLHFMRLWGTMCARDLDDKCSTINNNKIYKQIIIEKCTRIDIDMKLCVNSVAVLADFICPGPHRCMHTST